MNLEPLENCSPARRSAIRDVASVSMPAQGRRPHLAARYCRLLGLVYIAVLAFGCSTNALAMQSPPALAKNRLGKPGLQRLQLVQHTADALSVENISGTAGETIPLSIAVSEEVIDRRGFIMFRGMPSQLRLTKGFRTGNTWLLSLSQLQDISLVVPDDFQGAFEMDAILVFEDRKQRQSQKVSVSIEPKLASQSSKLAAKTEDPPVALRPELAIGSLEKEPPPPPPPPQTVEPEIEKAMLEQALELIAAGDIASARLIYQDLASNGSALGALGIAKTYDPEVLSLLDVVGLQPDLAEAERWYKRAAELGDEGAARRLKAIASTRQ